VAPIVGHAAGQAGELVAEVEVRVVNAQRRAREIERAGAQRLAPRLGQVDTELSEKCGRDAWQTTYGFRQNTEIQIGATAHVHDQFGRRAQRRSRRRQHAGQPAAAELGEQGPGQRRRDDRQRFA
jgi:hypothetical protein